jgi:hypothetical protein
MLSAWEQSAKITLTALAEPTKPVVHVRNRNPLGGFGCELSRTEREEYTGSAAADALGEGEGVEHHDGAGT